MNTEVAHITHRFYLNPKLLLHFWGTFTSFFEHNDRIVTLRKSQEFSGWLVVMFFLTQNLVNKSAIAQLFNTLISSYR